MHPGLRWLLLLLHACATVADPVWIVMQQPTALFSVVPRHLPCNHIIKLMGTQQCSLTESRYSIGLPLLLFHRSPLLSRQLMGRGGWHPLRSQLPAAMLVSPCASAAGNDTVLPCGWPLVRISSSRWRVVWASQRSSVSFSRENRRHP